jgi:hypothetical protein
MFVLPAWGVRRTHPFCWLRVADGSPASLVGDPIGLPIQVAVQPRSRAFSVAGFVSRAVCSPLVSHPDPTTAHGGGSPRRGLRFRGTSASCFAALVRSRPCLRFVARLDPRARPLLCCPVPSDASIIRPSLEKRPKNSLFRINDLQQVKKGSSRILDLRRGRLVRYSRF